MKIAICDDNAIMRDDLKNRLMEYAMSKNLIFLYSDFSNGDDLIASNRNFDLIFLDYKMDGINGLETARRLRKNSNNTAIIFLTSYPHVVFDTFEVNAYRFLLKPVDNAKLNAAMDDFLADLDDDKFIAIKTDEDTKRIKIDDIIYAEASDKYCYIRTVDENILYKKTLSEFEKLLPADKFYRSHRTYLVGFRHILSHTSSDILFDNKEKAQISKLKQTSFKNAFLDYIKRYNLSKR
ncbi:LytTR family DNA-binding domain-containing protein [Ruminococcus sp.]|uniref:LytR/AlgR family response regulator transcription factor n=1 Tax=Ruminococcus sp. TaxID=41978 RepID=UPI00258DCA1C|nr:LytTR family DNA-binding domain-containing protein [Ruminococcus sp.]MCR5021523.1 LytTR family DNA-binding domain-containing protein [Ruminococcus sp.]